MATAYKPARERIVLFEETPITDRIFELVLIDANRTKFNINHTTLEDALDGEDVDKAERVALRTQVIDNPLTPVQIGTKILQFFAVNPNQDVLVTQRPSAILIENIDGEETPLFYLNRDEVWYLAHGEGFATAVVPEALEV